MARKGPFSVPDPDDAEHTKAERWQQRYNAAQAAEDERRYQAARLADTYSAVSETLDTADKLNSAAAFAPAATAAISRAPDELATAKAAKAATGRVGRVLGPLSAVTGYAGDTGHGMKWDEATLKNGIPLAAGLAVSAATEGAPLLVGAAAELVTALGGSPAGRFVADRWRTVKDHVKNDPYWQDRVLRATSPFYLMDQLRRGR